MPVPPRYADTKIDANGRRVPAAEFEAAESPVRSVVIDPDTQIAADGTRQPAEEIDPNEVAPVGRTAEARMRDERVAQVEVAEADADEADEEAETETETEEEATDEALEDLKVVELKDRARDAGIEGFSTMKKDELVKALEGAED